MQAPVARMQAPAAGLPSRMQAPAARMQASAHGRQASTHAAAAMATTMSGARRSSGASTEVSVKEAVNEVIGLFTRQGTGDYVGEPISQVEHALQAADLAVRSGFGEEAVLAALLYDCGHMLGLERGGEQMEDCGVMDHENLGGSWLRGLGFSEQVATLVARHV